MKNLFFSLYLLLQTSFLDAQCRSMIVRQHTPPPTQALSQSSVKPVTEKGKENSQKY